MLKDIILGFIIIIMLLAIIIDIAIIKMAAQCPDLHYKKILKRQKQNNTN